MGNKLPLIIFILLCMTMISCSMIGCNFDNGYSREEFYDDAVLAQTADRYSYTIRNVSEGRLEFKGFFGRDTLQQEAVSEGKSLRISGNFEQVTTGLFKLVLVRKTDGRVTTITDQVGPFNQTFNQGDGEFLIKAIGYRATGKINYAVDLIENP
ncbi:hypothetical protein SpiGrapes_2197 [Sphaerochaeta pleomorpha str. Grapes]|uniref:Lipoprotein n=1 Tax=Sphaerochaeta pleomorpha (strain ATCC BAA-1885 / DSM 22778 / Grapes) TaxID=158190 RepID=G8QRX5_SPHPG|nr:hypothetical protein [Sphaerochaeta pleomorpha]AEV29973.1 hypothetical protein SpiGrapes_2197 [Sphaerochaeta pleomorpha str. Grapes]